MVRVGISLGDPSGIGPEVTFKALRNLKVRRGLSPILFGDASQQTSARGLDFRVVSRLAPQHRKPGLMTRAGGRAQLDYIEAAVAAAQRGELDALCTAPVSKEAITKGGHPFSGHTELLAEAFGVSVLMLMKGPLLSVALATNHVPLAQVAQAITKVKLVQQLMLLDASLYTLLHRRPRIAVCGLNPHAGDGGVLGREERTVIAPAIRAAQAKGLDVSGPFAADGLFATARHFAYDVALAMFHDQGLVATKTLDFERTVNVTLGLPVPRTSPDHGVAYDIAGKNKADPTPMVCALLEAAAFSGTMRGRAKRND
jgi:4-hydroxythreonine-4-phosphate dehydrogenase